MDLLLQLRSLSLSLDSLLDYTDKDMDESTFEVCSSALSISLYVSFIFFCLTCRTVVLVFGSHSQV